MLPEKTKQRSIFNYVIIVGLTLCCLYITSCAGVDIGDFTDCTTAKDKQSCCSNSPCANGCRTIVVKCSGCNTTCSYAKGYDGKECIAGSRKKDKAEDCCADLANRGCYNKLKTTQNFTEEREDNLQWGK